MAYFNGFLIGNVGGDVTLSATQSGKQVANVSLAVTDRYTDAQGNKQETTRWYRASFWGDSAVNAAKYIKKGDELGVEFSGVEANTYTDANGDARASVELKGARFRLLRNGRTGNGNGQPANDEVVSDDMPF